MLLYERPSRKPSHPPGSAFLPSMRLGKVREVSELGSDREISAGSDIQPDRASARAADALRLGVRGEIHGAPDARALHHMPELDVAARRGGECPAAGSAEAGSRRADAPVFQRMRPAAEGGGLSMVTRLERGPHDVCVCPAVTALSFNPSYPSTTSWPMCVTYLPKSTRSPSTGGAM